MTSTATTATHWEQQQLRALLSQRALNSRAGELLADAVDLVAETLHSLDSQQDRRRSPALKTAQLNNLAHLAGARGSVADITNFITRQMAKEGSSEGWRFGGFGEQLRGRLGGRGGQHAALAEQHRAAIITEVQQGLTDVFGSQTAAALTEKDRIWREQLHLDIARRYISFVVNEYQYAAGA